MEKILNVISLGGMCMPKLAGWFVLFIFGLLLQYSDTLTTAGKILAWLLILVGGGVFFVTWGFIIYRQVIKSKNDESTESDNRAE